MLHVGGRDPDRIQSWFHPHRVLRRRPAERVVRRLAHHRDGDADNRNVRERCVTFVVAAGAVVVLAWASGGYFPSEWGLVALGFLLVLLATIVLSDGVEIGGLGVVLLGALAALGAWQLLSLWWSSSPSLPVNEAERTFLYLAARRR